MKIDKTLGVGETPTSPSMPMDLYQKMLNDVRAMEDHFGDLMEGARGWRPRNRAEVRLLMRLEKDALLLGARVGDLIRRVMAPEKATVTNKDE